MVAGLLGTRRRGCTAERVPGPHRPGPAVVVATASGSKAVRRAWAASAGASLAAITPFLLFTQTQLFQVRWITTLTDNPLVSITRDQYFDRAQVFAIIAGIAILAGLIAVPRHGQLASDRPWRVVVVATVWVALRRSSCSRIPP